MPRDVYNIDNKIKLIFRKNRLNLYSVFGSFINSNLLSLDAALDFSSSVPDEVFLRHIVPLMKEPTFFRW